ncbi:complement C1q tumor necrosis factor-related protein 1 [Platysternon megacephalum]|uniref:Complement C1q tumor necrosis factor-related protein 1 n=1 Tax=Platysternon megacephalum TaxID=55544 RepID=A0A4D9EG41_9SAUR|nr:complement C1q tumor necrosis factor-related protein 1 [Platysternon megacephalum]
MDRGGCPGRSMEEGEGRRPGAVEGGSGHPGREGQELPGPRRRYPALSRDTTHATQAPAPPAPAAERGGAAASGPCPPPEVSPQPLRSHLVAARAAAAATAGQSGGQAEAFEGQR